MSKSKHIYKKHIIKKCLECGNEFEVLYCRRKRKFCCYKCSVNHSKGKKHYWIPSTVFKKGHKVSEEIRKKISKSKIGKPGLIGENHPNWKGGKTTKERKILMSRKEYKQWRIKVIERDNYTCQECGQIGGDLQAHHIKDWANNKKERYLIRNGVTLCIECHKYVHRFERQLIKNLKNENKLKK